MKDERINERLNIIKRNNLIIIALVSTVFLILKAIANGSFISLIPELYLLVSSGIVLIVANFLESSDEVSDERTYKNSLKIYDSGFWYVVLSGILVYFISILFIDYDFTSLAIAPNTSINSIMFWCMLLSLISIRKNKMTFNPQIIENTNKVYYGIILNRIFYMFAYYLVVFIFTFIIKLFVNSDISGLTLFITIAISFLAIALQYFLFSVYEKYHYDELVQREDESKIFYVSKKVWLILFIVLVYGVVTGILNGLISYAQYNHLLYDNSFLQVLYILTLLLRFRYLTIFIMTILMYIIIFKTINNLELNFKKYLPIVIVIISITLLYSLFYQYFSIGVSMGLRIGEDSAQTLIILGKISMYMTYIRTALNIVVAYVILSQTFIKEAILYFLSIILPLLAILSRLFFDEPQDLLLYGFIISSSIGIISGILKLISIRGLSNKYLIKEIE
ncbi:hypothetical protein ACAG96_02625 [Candidatus Izemoplasma sp. B36]|uniref:hypothetical protein n=1 Tax=Candidatus Izemoplasma sp. B36 TaxID=3242468 RepID=UPI0035591452